MRISIDEKDRAYDLKRVKGVKRVTLDGKPVSAVTADDVEGYVLMFAQAPDGSLQVKQTMEGPEPVLLEGRGKVVIEMDERRWDTERRGSTKVEVGRAPNGDIWILVHSVVRPGAIKRYVYALATHPSSRQALIQGIGIGAGAAAEAACESFNDTIDPSECASVAMEQAKLMLADEAAAS